MQQSGTQTHIPAARYSPSAASNQHFLRLIARYQEQGIEPDFWEAEFVFARRRRHNAWLKRCRENGADPILMIGTTEEEGASRLAEIERAMAAEERAAQRYFRMRLAESRGEYPCYMDLCDVLQETEGKLETCSRIIARDLRSRKPAKESTQRWQSELAAQREHILRQMAEGYPDIFGPQRATAARAKFPGPGAQQPGLN